MSSTIKVQLACNAMATRFEFVLCGSDKAFLQAAGEEAIRELHYIESKLSFYRHNSAISRINANAENEPVTVDAEIFTFLQAASELSLKAEGAFDLTIGPLMKVWGFVRNSGAMPDEHQVQQALKKTGMHLVLLNKKDRTVQFTVPGMLFDPGAIGKGYALDQAAALLKETGVKHAFLHGGTSTAVAWGESPDGKGWNIAIRDPDKTEGEADELPKVFELKNQALSVSAVWGKAFKAEGKTLGHVLDPRTGRPVEGARLAACVACNATTADACSTAMLVLGSETPSVMASVPGISEFFIMFNSGKTING